MTNQDKGQLVDGIRKNITTLLEQPNARKHKHTGLWFDKYISHQQQKDSSLGKGQISPYKALIDTVACIPEPAIYTQFFNRWQTQIETMCVAIDGCKYRVCSKPARMLGRLAIGLGDESVIETAVTLHHTYGTPLIPGSALKGLASAYAHQRLEDPRWRKKGELHTLLFGTTSSAGYITFFDALYVPGSGHLDKEGVPHALWPDVITVHHKDYYTGKEPKAPADWDNPTPIPLLTATGTYLIALGGPVTWVDLTFKLLTQALKEHGIGAKTSSGYGRMTFEASPSVSKKQPNEREQPALNTSESTTEQAAPSSEGIISANTQIDTRAYGSIERVASAENPGSIIDRDGRHHEYGLGDVINAAPGDSQQVRFKPGKKKVQRGKEKKNVNWAFDVEISVDAIKGAM